MLKNVFSGGGNMNEEKKDRSEDTVKVTLDTQVPGDIDDFIFGEEGYRCSEK
jgi:hypothetical protein